MKAFGKINGNKIDLVLERATDAIPEKNWLPAYYFNIVLHNTDTVVGFCDARIGHNENTYYGGNVGYTVLPEYRGNGYAVEVVELLTKLFSAHGTNKIYITNSPDNTASIRVCEKLGVKFIELAELPENNSMRLEDGDTHKNIFELKI